MSGVAGLTLNGCGWLRSGRTVAAGWLLPLTLLTGSGSGCPVRLGGVLWHGHTLGSGPCRWLLSMRGRWWMGCWGWV